MYRYAPPSQIVHSEHAADDISSEVVEDQHLPYRLAVRVEDWGRLRDQAVCGRRFVPEVAIFGRDVVEVEDALDRRYASSVTVCARGRVDVPTYLSISEGLVGRHYCGRQADAQPLLQFSACARTRTRPSAPSVTCSCESLLLVASWPAVCLTLGMCGCPSHAYSSIITKPASVGNCRG